MINRETVESHLNKTFESATAQVSGATLYEGKVRDCYVKGSKRIIITSDRISAFDVILGTIPFKGKVLNDMATFWFSETSDIVDNHLIDRPHPNVLVCKEAKILPVEVIVRAYLTGSAWRDYEAGKSISGIQLEPGLKKSHHFQTPIITPSTKAEKGKHDEPISEEEILKQGLVEETLWQEVCAVSLKLFERGTKKAAEQGLILVDTKYEFGTLDGKLILADEIHTSDSSRYWVSETYEEAFASGEEPRKLDKEFLRSWLMELGFMGDGEAPILSDKIRADVAVRYIEAYEIITGKTFKPNQVPLTQEYLSELVDSL